MSERTRPRSGRILRRLGVAAAAMIAWVAVAQPAGADPGAVRLAATGGAGLVLPRQGGYLPTELRFREGGVKLSVTIDKVDFHDDRKLESADYAARPAAAPRQAVTTASLRGVGRRVLWTSVSNDRPEVRFQLAGPAGDRGQIVLHLRGVDRVIAGSGGQYSVRSVRGSEAMEIPDRAVVCQSRDDQHGVLITAPAGASAGRLRIVPTTRGVAVHVPWRSGASAVDPAVQVAVRGVRGDATIALESVAGRPAPVVSGAPRFHLAAAVAPRRIAAKDPPPVRKPADNPADPDPEPKPGRGPWEFFTGSDRAFAPLLADPREASIKVGLMYGRHAQKYLDVTIGGDLLLARRQLAADRRITISGRGLISSRFNTCQESFPQLNMDFFGGVAVGVQRGDDTFELYAFHESSHLGDETMESGSRRRIDYAREALRVLWAHQFGPLRVYGGPTLNVRGFPSDIAGRVTLQAGAEYRFDCWGIPMYVAADLQSKQERGWDVNFTGQYGLELGDPEKYKKRPRVFLEFFNGFSNMGQFWNDRETYVMLGLGYDF